jgi:hypothetical protein
VNRVVAEEVWAIGRFVMDQRQVFWPSTAGERERARDHSARCFSSLGIGRGTSVNLISKLSEGVQAVPLADALRALEAVVMPAEANGYDAARVLSFVRRFPIDAAVGIAPATVEAIENLGVELSIFGRVPVLVARPGAYERLRSAGLKPYRWLTLGPSVAIECAERQGAHVDGLQWDLSTDGGEILMSSRLPVASGLLTIRTGVAGEVRDQPCRCGIPGPRVALS